MKKTNKQNLIHSSKLAKLQTRSTPRKSKQKSCKTVEDIWTAIKDRDIDMSYAIVGYTYSNGIPIFNSDDVINLLMMHGYSMESICDFLVDFSKVHESNPQTPIMMMSSNKMKLCQALK